MDQVESILGPCRGIPRSILYYGSYDVVASSVPYTVLKDSLGCAVNNARSSQSNDEDKSLLFEEIKRKLPTSTRNHETPPPPPPHETPVTLNQSTQQQAYHPKHHHCDRNHCAPPPYPPGTWERYLRATNDDVEEAQKRLSETLQWRLDHGMDSILTLPHPYFDVIKQFYPHAFHLHGYNQEPVYVEFPAKIDLRAMRDHGVSLNDLLRHYALITEFMWTYISPDQNGPRSRGITVIDLDGLRLQDFVGEVVTFVKRAASFTSRHYPESAEQYTL
ncbi:hypothetical protein HJC23_001248 [Cyclotella cryptica]|uniref:CRAL-TRIO domain-containing protein n=1 Tax=Cyclotella cryptica TaxID=29204 RepID=A0ABD3NSX0_9STRA